MNDNFINITVGSILIILVHLLLALISGDAFRCTMYRMTTKRRLLMTKNTAPGDDDSSFYSLKERGADGSDISFEMFRDHVVYGVNVAPNCDLPATEYAMLASCKDLGVAVAIFPCSQFNCESSDHSITKELSHVSKEMNATMFGIGDVNGDHIRPAYAYMKSHGIFSEEVSANFAGKFIVRKDGTG